MVHNVHIFPQENAFFNCRDTAYMESFQLCHVIFPGMFYLSIYILLFFRKAQKFNKAPNKPTRPFMAVEWNAAGRAPFTFAGYSCATACDKRSKSPACLKLRCFFFSFLLLYNYCKIHILFNCFFLNGSQKLRYWFFLKQNQLCFLESLKKLFGSYAFGSLWMISYVLKCTSWPDLRNERDEFTSNSKANIHL